jgi:hypothetical protein
MRSSVLFAPGGTPGWRLQTQQGRPQRDRLPSLLGKAKEQC